MQLIDLAPEGGVSALKRGGESGSTGPSLRLDSRNLMEGSVTLQRESDIGVTPTVEQEAVLGAVTRSFLYITWKGKSRHEVLGEVAALNREDLGKRGDDRFGNGDCCASSLGGALHCGYFRPAHRINTRRAAHGVVPGDCSLPIRSAGMRGRPPARG